MGDRSVYAAALTLAGRLGNRVELRVSNAELAREAGVSEDTVERAIPRLHRAGLMIRTFKPGPAERFTRRASEYVVPRWVNVPLEDARPAFAPTATPTPAPVPIIPADTTPAAPEAARATLEEFKALRVQRERPVLEGDALEARRVQLARQVAEVLGADQALEARRAALKAQATALLAADASNPDAHVQPATSGPSPILPPEGGIGSVETTDAADALAASRIRVTDAADTRATLANAERPHVLAALDRDGTLAFQRRPQGGCPPFPFPTHPPRNEERRYAPRIDGLASLDPALAALAKADRPGSYAGPRVVRVSRRSRPSYRAVGCAPRSPAARTRPRRLLGGKTETRNPTTANWYAPDMAACKVCGERTESMTLLCRSCRAQRKARREIEQRIVRERLDVSTIGGQWWVWDAGNVLVSGRPTREAAVEALVAGNDDEG